MTCFLSKNSFQLSEKNKDTEKSSNSRKSVIFKQPAAEKDLLH